MATYIHNNYKNTVALTAGYTQSSTTKITTASGSSFTLGSTYASVVTPPIDEALILTES